MFPCPTVSLFQLVSGPRRAGILEPRATSLISLPETCPCCRKIAAAIRDERRPLDAPKATAPPAWGRRGRAVTRARGFNSVACCVRGGRTHHPGQDGCRQGQLLCPVNSKLPPRPHRRAIRARPGGEAAAARKASTAPASAAPSRPLAYLGSIQVACRAPDRPACAWLRRLQRTPSGNQRERPTTR